MVSGILLVVDLSAGMWGSLCLCGLRGLQYSEQQGHTKDGHELYVAITLRTGLFEGLLGHLSSFELAGNVDFSSYPQQAITILSVESHPLASIPRCTSMKGLLVSLEGYLENLRGYLEHLRGYLEHLRGYLGGGGIGGDWNLQFP